MEEFVTIALTSLYVNDEYMITSDVANIITIPPLILVYDVLMIELTLVLLVNTIFQILLSRLKTCANFGG